jgi:hypothetical protein
MPGIQVLRIAFFLVLPLAAAVGAMVGRRRSVPASGWKGLALMYGPVVGAASSLAVFVVVIVGSDLAGH